MAEAARVPWLLAALTVLLEIGYPLISQGHRAVLTVATVVCFFLASTSHALLRRGARWTVGFVAVTTGLGLLAESVGTHTGVPFGSYSYSGALGPRLLAVPWVIPLAWAMMAYPCLLVGQRLGRGPVAAAAIGAAGLASWDLFLDPQMVAEGYWRWAQVRHALPGSPAVPLSNDLGWLAVAAVMMGLLQALGRRPARDGQPAALFLWTYASSVMSALVFFGRPGVALLGGLLMGCVALPYARSLGRGTQPRRRPA